MILFVLQAVALIAVALITLLWADAPRRSWNRERARLQRIKEAYGPEIEWQRNHIDTTWEFRPSADEAVQWRNQHQEIK